MKILTKLLAGFVAVALLCAVVGGVAIVQVSNLNKSITSLADETIPALGYLKTIDLEFTNLKAAVRSAAHPMGLDNEEYFKRQLANIQNARTNYRAARESYEKLSKTDQEKDLYDDVVGLMAKAAEYNDSIIEISTRAKSVKGPARDALEAQVFDLIAGDKRLAFDNLQVSLRKLIAYDQQYYGYEVPQKALKSAEQAVVILLGITFLAFAVAIVLGLLLGRGISRSLNASVRMLDKIAAGDVSERLTVKTKDEFLQVASSLNKVAETVNALVEEAGLLTDAALEGRLSFRGDAMKFSGGYHAIVEGVNQTLDAVIGPLNVAATYVDRISKGDIPPKITDAYSGDFNLIKNNLNVCIEAVNALVADSNMLAQAAVEGRLQTRADGQKHQGDFRRVVDGVNKTLDLVIAPVNETIAILKRMAEGDLSTSMLGDYKGDFDILKTALNDTIDSINDILGQVVVAVDQVSAGSQQVSQASQSLSQGATEQASSLEEITSSVTEISGQTKQNTENAVQVNSLAKTAQSDAQQGNVQMQDLVAAMSDINNSAEEIRKIVKAIDDISFQINLLALNANVEAARAGKYGKGFAVVAEEVRNLAVRSAGSVKETTNMVDEAIANIGKGNALVSVTAKQLSSIVEGASKVASLAEEVSIASREQSQGLEQISTGLNQIDQVTQSNTASAEESASAAEELSSQSQQLKSMVSRFKLKEREARMSNADMIAMLRSELAAAQGKGGAAPRALALHRDDSGAAKAAAPAGKPPRAFVNPADVISLDDDDFGKF